MFMLPFLAMGCGSGGTSSTSHPDGGSAHDGSVTADAGKQDAASKGDATFTDAHAKTDSGGHTMPDSGGSDSPVADGGAPPGDGGVDAGHAPKDGGSAPGDASDASCVNGASCGEAGICAHGSCCAAESACGSTCCGAGLLCVAGGCVQAGASCFDTYDCPAGQYCQFSVNESIGPNHDGGVDAGSCVATAQSRGNCLPLPSLCPGDAGTPDGGSCFASCQVHNAAGPVAPALKYSWGGVTTNTPNDVMMQPIVVPMEDTNCDGKVDGNDIPDIVFTSFAKGSNDYNGTLHAISVRGGALVNRWSVPSPVMIDGTPYNIDPATELAGADLDGMPGSEIVACLIPQVDGGAPIIIGDPAVLAVFHTDGTLAWSNAVVMCRMPEIADLDGDGTPEVIVEGGIFNSKTYALTPFTTETGGTISNIGYFTVGDLDGDGKLDIVASGAAYHANGVRFVSTGWSGAYVALGDLDRDGKPEVVATSGYGEHYISIWHYEPGATVGTSFAWLQRNLDTVTVPNAADYTGVAAGTPTIADFNGDGTPDVAVTGSVTYTVFDGKKLLGLNVGAGGTDGGNAGEFFLWEYYPLVTNNNGVNGSTAFDLVGGGLTTAIHSDQQELRVLSGLDGGALFQTCNTGNTLWNSPVVADIDEDGHADIVVVSNSYASGNSLYACTPPGGGANSESGIRVFSDPNLAWVRTRSIWNEYGYHVTNVNDDGTIPVAEAANWKQPELDNYRQNRQPAYEMAAPDAVVSLAPSCSGLFILTATVKNIGEAELPGHVQVDFWGGTPASRLATAFTDVPLYAGQSTTVEMTGIASAAGPFYAIVDPMGSYHPAWQECRTNNNQSPTVTVASVCGH
jgi:hypothetical protein